MLDIEFGMSIYQSVETNVERVMKNRKMPKFVSDHLKTKKLVLNSLLKKVCFWSI